jgi:polyferredoxin
MTVFNHNRHGGTPTTDAGAIRGGKQSPKTRSRMQSAVFLLTLAVGVQFFIYVGQVSTPSAVTVQRPPGVEGFLPIGALMGWKRFLLTGHWDPIHPAAMVIFGFAGLVSLTLRKSFCAWFCPVGTLSEWLWKGGRRILGKNFRLPGWADLPLRSLKYLLLGFFAWAISSMDTDAIHRFLQSPYYKLSDVKMLFFFTRMTALTAGVLVFLAAASILVQNFWCRYLCPYGALMGLLSWTGPTRVRRDAETCTGCGRCTRACPHRLAVDRLCTVRSPECSGCMDCVLACPEKSALAMETAGAGKRSWSPAALGLAIAGIFVFSVYTARISGHWQSRVSPQEIRTLMTTIDDPENAHPGVDF